MFGLAITSLRIFIELNFIAKALEEIIYWYNDNNLFSFQYNSWSTQVYEC